MITHVLARTAWGEARSNGPEGMTAVLNVIMNRASKPGWWGKNPVEVCLMNKPVKTKKGTIKIYQFSCWSPSDPNLKKMLAVDEKDNQFRIALMLEQAALEGKLKDITHGATHYHTKSSYPAWRHSLTKLVEIGDHIFYR